MCLSEVKRVLRLWRHLIGREHSASNTNHNLPWSWIFAGAAERLCLRVFVFSALNSWFSFNSNISRWPQTEKSTLKDFVCCILYSTILKTLSTAHPLLSPGCLLLMSNSWSSSVRVHYSTDKTTTVCLVDELLDLFSRPAVDILWRQVLFWACVETPWHISATVALHFFIYFFYLEWKQQLFICMD